MRGWETRTSGSEARLSPSTRRSTTLSLRGTTLCVRLLGSQPVWANTSVPSWLQKRMTRGAGGLLPRILFS